MVKSGPQHDYFLSIIIILKRDRQPTSPFPQWRKFGLVHEHNNNIKKGRAFENFLTDGENQQCAAAAVHVAGGR